VISVENLNFSHPRVFSPSLNGVPLELVIGARSQTTRMVGLPGRERSFTVS